MQVVFVHVNIYTAGLFAIELNTHSECQVGGTMVKTNVMDVNDDASRQKATVHSAPRHHRYRVDPLYKSASPAP